LKTQFAMWGNSLACRIPAALAREIDAAPGRAAEISVEEGRLVIALVGETPAYSLDALLDGVTEETLHGEVATGAAVGNELA
jgi:antitoxin MazE